MERAATASGVWGASHRSLTIGIVLTVSMGAFEAMAVATILPATVAEIGGLELYGWTFSAFMLANLVGTSVAGLLADRRGAALPFVLGTTLFVGGLIGAGGAPAMHWLILGRTAQGLGAGAIASISYVAVARAYAPDVRPHMMALLSSAWVVPGLIGPAIAGGLADYVSWRWVFFGLAPLTVVSALWALPSLRRLGPLGGADAEPNRILTALRLAAGTGLLLFGLEHSAILTGVGCAAVGLVLGIPALRGLTPAGTLRAAPGPPAAIATLGLLCAAFFGTETFLPLSLTLIREQSSTMVGIALTAATLSWTAGAWLQARLAPRSAPRTLALSGLVLTLAGIATTTTILNEAVPVLAAAVTWGVAGLGMGIAYSTLTLIALQRAEAGREGAVSAAVQLANVLGTAIGAGVGGATISRVASTLDSDWIGLALVSAFTLGFAVLAIVTGRRV